MNSTSPFLQYGNVRLLNVPHAAALAEECIVQDCYQIKSLQGRWAVADIGACYGEFAYFAQSLRHHVLALEPSPESFLVLNLNGHLNRQLDIASQIAVVGEDRPTCVIPFSYRPHHPAGSGPDCGDGIALQTRWVTMSTVINILRASKLPILVKLDVEGAEVEIFDHLDTWIDGVSTVSMETHNNDADVFGKKLEDRGFKVELWGTSPYPLPKWEKGMIGGLVIARK